MRRDWGRTNVLRPFLIFFAVCGVLAMIPMQRDGGRKHRESARSLQKFNLYREQIQGRLIEGHKKLGDAAPFTMEQALELFTNPPLKREWGESSDPKVSLEGDSIVIELSGIPRGVVPPARMGTSDAFRWKVTFEGCERWIDIFARKYQIHPEVSREEFLEMVGK